MAQAGTHLTTLSHVLLDARKHLHRAVGIVGVQLQQRCGYAILRASTEHAKSGGGTASKHNTEFRMPQNGHPEEPHIPCCLPHKYLLVD